MLLCSEVVTDPGIWCEAEFMRFPPSFLALPREDSASDLRDSASPPTKKSILPTRAAQKHLLRTLSHGQV